MNQTIHDHLAFLYGDEAAPALTEQLTERLHRFQAAQPAAEPVAPRERLSEQDVVLITYGDMVQTQGEAPLHTLGAFLKQWVADRINTVHILPFYPYSSDDGFSVIDYFAVDPALGSWEDVGQLRSSFRLMFDAVVNHISAESAWFQAFLRDEEPYCNYFTVVDSAEDLSAVFRPRALPLLSPFATPSGEKHVWTTFSADQIDLNYANPQVLLDVVDVLLCYVSQGAELIRLDAIAFIWKELGTDCIHLPQTHRIIQLMRAVLDVVAPQVVLITETNVPHPDNISYFGNGRNEAQMVYNFSLPPLTLHAFHTGCASVLSEWASGLSTPSEATTFFNFLASHDGIGLTPAKGILDETEIDAIAERVQQLGGYVSYRTHGDGSRSPYELNINYLDALGDANQPDADATKAQRFLCAQAIMLALAGVPGIYFHSLFGSRNWREGVEQSGRFRTINRQKLQRSELEAELTSAESLRQRVFDGYRALLAARTSHAAFHPQAAQEVLTVDEAVFGLRRLGREGEVILCLHNVSGEARTLTLDASGEWEDMVNGGRISAEGNRLTVELPPYAIAWLQPA